MAKLNVVIPAVDVMVNGVTYRKVDRDAQAGDIIRFADEYLPRYVHDGAFYEVSGISGGGNPYIKDEDGDTYSTAGDSFEVYAPISAPAAQPPTDTITFQGAIWRKVVRDVREGDAIKFTDEDRSSYLTESELYVVDYVDGAGDPRITDDDGDGYDAGCDEFEVYEKVTDSAAQEYREVKRKAEVGEKIRVTSAPRSGEEFSEGDVLTVSSVDKDGDIWYVEEVDIDGVIFYQHREHGNEYVVLEPVTKAAAPTELTQPERLKVGEYARVVSADIRYLDDGIKKGSIVKIVYDDSTYRPLKGVLLDGEGVGWFTESELVRATDVEVAAAKREALIAQFSVGDYVKLTVEDGKRPRFGYGSASNGDIGKVTRKYDNHIAVDFPSTQSGWRADPSELVKLTAEEVAEQAEEKRWAAIGRKVNEFKVGDVVECTGSLAGHAVGTIGIVVYDEASCAKLRVKANGDVKSHTGLMKLLVPVEQRFDRPSAENAAEEVDAA